jgi:hypothetical protein
MCSCVALARTLAHFASKVPSARGGSHGNRNRNRNRNNALAASQSTEKPGNIASMNVATTSSLLTRLRFN